MRKYAKLSPRFWTGRVGHAVKGDLAALALAPYLIGGPMANMIGLYRLPVALAADDLGMTRDQVEGALAKLHDAGFIRWDSETSRVWIVDAAKHELPARVKDRDKRTAAVATILEDHSCSPLAQEFIERYADVFDSLPTLSDAYPAHPSEGTPPTLLSQKQEQEQKQDQEQKQEQGQEGGRPAHPSDPSPVDGPEWIRRFAEGCPPELRVHEAVLSRLFFNATRDGAERADLVDGAQRWFRVFRENGERWSVFPGWQRWFDERRWTWSDAAIAKNAAPLPNRSGGRRSARLDEIDAEGAGSLLDNAVRADKAGAW